MLDANNAAQRLFFWLDLPKIGERLPRSGDSSVTSPEIGARLDLANVG